MPIATFGVRSDAKKVKLSSINFGAMAENAKGERFFTMGTEWYVVAPNGEPRRVTNSFMEEVTRLPVGSTITLTSTL